MALHSLPRPHPVTVAARRIWARVRGPLGDNAPFAIFAAGILTAMAYLGQLLLRLN